MAFPEEIVTMLPLATLVIVWNWRLGQRDSCPVDFRRGQKLTQPKHLNSGP